jgi:hypothetical protein
LDRSSSLKSVSTLDSCPSRTVYRIAVRPSSWRGRPRRRRWSPFAPSRRLSEQRPPRVAGERDQQRGVLLREDLARQEIEAPSASSGFDTKVLLLASCSEPIPIDDDEQVVLRLVGGSAPAIQGLPRSAASSSR